MSTKTSLEDIVSLCKRRGFIFQGSEVYGGLSGTWDYGPLGVTLKRNIMALWWKMFVEDRDDMYGVDAAILMNQKVWQASGHVETFTDPLVECAHCKGRFRADHIVKSGMNENGEYPDFADHGDSIFEKLMNDNENPEHIFTLEYSKKFINEILNEDKRFLSEKGDAQLLEKVVTAYLNEAFAEAIFKVEKGKLISDDEARKEALFQRERLTSSEFTNGLDDLVVLNLRVKCPNCGQKGNFGKSREFNMMFKTNVGPVDDEASISYLRPETAQGIFTNFKNVVDTFYPDLPFGVGQQGKAFRNEISPRDFIFRSREFEQMEIEYFVHPDKWEESFEAWRVAIWEWCEALGLAKESVHELEVPENDRAHYSKRTIDFEFDFPIGREELLGLAYRTDFDLGNIQRVSGKSMEYTVKGSTDKFVPHVIEPSFGLERAMMAVLSAAYTEDEVNGEKRVYLKLPEHLAPVKFAVSPLLKNKPELVEKAREVYTALKKKHGAVMWDDNGNIGKRYRRQDEIGTPYCVVIDFDTLEDNTVTVRNRDTTEQTRVLIESLL